MLSCETQSPCRGSDTKVEPRPSVLSTHIRPPWRSTMLLAIANPSPVQMRPASHWARNMRRWGGVARSMSTFTFQPRWKEELVCTGPGGSFILELPMGRLSAYLPTEAAWARNGPAWARDLWPVLRKELQEWCEANNALFYIDESAWVDQVIDSRPLCDPPGT